MPLLTNGTFGLLGLGSLALLGLLGCAHAPESPAAPPPPTAPAERWLEVFPAYPGARPLGSQHVVGNGMHIQWSSFAIKAPPEEVAAFYARQFPGAQQTDPRRIDVRAENGKVLAVHPAEGSYPRADLAPGPDEKTVVIVSQAIR